MHTVPLAFEHLRRGGVVLLRDQDGTGHLVLAAEMATVATVEFMTQAGIGQFQLAMTVADLNQNAANPVFPESSVVFASEDGLFQTGGVIEAAADLVRLSGLTPPVLLRATAQTNINSFAGIQSLPTLSIADLTEYRYRTEGVLDLVAVADLPTIHSEYPFKVHSFKSRFDGVEHLALVSSGLPMAVPLVRIHSECLTGDAFGSLRCDCGPQLDESMRLLAATPGGILIYMRGHEGRGIGLANKMRAYAFQDQGMDTVEANRALGLPDDARDYAHAAAILRALGHDKVRLLSNNPEKAASLQRHKIEVMRVEPLVIPPNPFNERYLGTKAEKFGHTLPLKLPSQQMHPNGAKQPKSC
jgi:3,4-dihydroxy 2-butanone 4-phosphate synthase/GTP cyclohydrolase II